MPAGAQRLAGVRHHLPRLGEVEHHPVEVVLVDALVAVAQLDVVALERVGAEERAHVGARPVGEVLAQLVADDLRAPAQHRHAQRAAADTALEHAHARTDVGEHADRGEVLRVDHLRATGHLDDEVLQRRTQHGVRRAAGAARDEALALADEVGVRDEAVVAVELAVVDQGDQVAALLAVDQQGLVAGSEQAHRRPRRIETSSTGTGAWAEAVSTSRQNAHTSPLVGAPHCVHAPTVSSDAWRASASSGAMRSMKFR